MTAVIAPAGPLTTTAELPESMLFGSTTQAATWLAYVGLLGRFDPIWRRSQWMQWNGFAWERCESQDVHRAVRHALGSVYDRRMAQNPDAEEVMLLLRLMDLNWRLGPLMWELRRALRDRA